MKIASTISRYLLGLMFAVFGANGFLHFINQPPPSSAFATQFFTAAVGSNFMVLVFALQLIAGILLLADRYVPLALVVLGAILTNVLDFHITMDPGGIPPGIVATILWALTFAGYRKNFRGIFAPGAETS